MLAAGFQFRSYFPMPPPIKSEPARQEVSTLKLIFIALLCSVLSSATTLLLLPRLAPQLLAANETAAKFKLPPSPLKPAIVQNATPAKPKPDADTEVAENPQLQLKNGAADFALAKVVADNSSDVITTLQGEYDTNEFFNNRGTLKKYLNDIKTSAQKFSSTPETSADASKNAQDLADKLDRAIARLDELIQTQTTGDQTVAAQMIRDKLAEMRSPLP